MKKTEKTSNLPGGRGRRVVAGEMADPDVICARRNAGKKFTEVSIFTPCADWFRLLETVNLTASDAACGDVILLSPACSSFDQFRNHNSGGGVSRNLVGRLADATGGMVGGGHPNTQAVGKSGRVQTGGFEKKDLSLHRGFLRQNPGAKTQPNPTSQERTLNSANDL
jgi:hypothetical protein